jgi:flagellar basal-body rod protein FlgB
MAPNWTTLCRLISLMFRGGAFHNRRTMLHRLTDTLNFQAEALVLRSQRQRLIAGNIANADTPGYVAKEMDFASALRQATGQAGAASLATPRAGHLPVALGAPAEAGLKYATAAQTNLDRNTVDMDRERASFADNSVKYEATLRFINGSVRTMLDAIKGQSG